MVFQQFQNLSMDFKSFPQIKNSFSISVKDWSEWCEERERKKEKKEKEENAYNPPAGCIFSPPAVFLYFLPPAGCFCICRFSFLRACSLFLYVFDCPHLFFVFFYCRFFLTTHSLFYCPQVFCICFLTGRRFLIQLSQRELSLFSARIV